MAWASYQKMFRGQLFWFNRIANWNQQLKNKESAEDVANDIMDMEIYIWNEKTNAFVSGLTLRNDRLNDYRVDVNSLLKRKCDNKNTRKYVLPATQTWI